MPVLAHGTDPFASHVTSLNRVLDSDSATQRATTRLSTHLNRGGMPINQGAVEEGAVEGGCGRGGKLASSVGKADNAGV